MTLAATQPKGEISSSENRVEGYRNFATKLWNAARFCEMNGCVYSPSFDPTGCKLAVNQWIGKKVSETVSQVEAGISEYRFNEAAGAIYQFTWAHFVTGIWNLLSLFCRMMRRQRHLKPEQPPLGPYASYCCYYTLLCHLFPGTGKNFLGGWYFTYKFRLAQWPCRGNAEDDNQDMDWIVRLISQVRSVRGRDERAAQRQDTLMIKNAGDMEAEGFGPRYVDHASGSAFGAQFDA